MLCDVLFVVCVCCLLLKQHDCLPSLLLIVIGLFLLFCAMCSLFRGYVGCLLVCCYCLLLVCVLFVVRLLARL